MLFKFVEINWKVVLGEESRTSAGFKPALLAVSRQITVPKHQDGNLTIKECNKKMQKILPLLRVIGVWMPWFANGYITFHLSTHLFKPAVT